MTCIQRSRSLFSHARTTRASRQDILSLTKIGEVDLPRLLQSLALGKARVLSKAPMGKDILPSDVFTANPAFTSKMMRVKIPLIAARESAPEREVPCIPASTYVYKPKLSLFVPLGHTCAC